MFAGAGAGGGCSCESGYQSGALLSVRFESKAASGSAPNLKPQARGLKVATLNLFWKTCTPPLCVREDSNDKSRQSVLPSRASHVI